MLTDDQAKENIAANVQSLLDVRGWTQRDLAKATGESDMRVSILVRGTKLSSAGMLARVAEALETTVDALLSKPRRRRPTNNSSKVA